MSTYKIIRFHRDNDRRDVLYRGLTLEEAQEHCKNPETSSSTCTQMYGITYTEQHGPWFDGYEEE